jgi:hypothetical protein
MRRRELLRLLTAATAAGLAGCANVDPSLPLATGRPLETPTPSPSPSPSPTPSPTAAAAAAASPTPEPSDTPATPEPTVAPEPETEPSPEAAPEPAGDRRAVIAVGRDGLGLPAPRSGGRAHTITGLAVHHTAAPTAAASKGPARFRSHARSHRDQGWVDIAYHWGVDTGGNIYELRSEAIAGDTNTSYDPAGWFLVVCEGNFEESAPPQAMLDAVADLFAYAATKHGVAASTLRGHRDLAPTLCPGANLQAQLPTLVKMVDARLATGGVSVRAVNDPDRVARIEAG